MAGSSKKEKAIALLKGDGHPSPLGEGPGVRASQVQTQNAEYQTPKILHTHETHQDKLSQDPGYFSFSLYDIFFLWERF
jgi:hypothetical protein